MAGESRRYRTSAISLRARNSSSNWRKSLATRPGMLVAKRAFRPSSAMSQPMMSRELRPGMFAAPRRSAGLRLRWTESRPPRRRRTRRWRRYCFWKCRSCGRSARKARPPGTAPCCPARRAASSAARDRPITPPAQPRPKIGRRWMSRRRPMRSTSSASRLGVATPVVEATTMVSISLGA